MLRQVRCCFLPARGHTLNGELRPRLHGAQENAPNCTPVRADVSTRQPDPGSFDRRPSGLQDGGVRPLCGRTFQEERILPMRIAYLLLPLTLAFVAVTSGCHHRCCCGGCVAPCCSPCCGSCCCYRPPVEGPIPPMAVPPAPVVAPIAHCVKQADRVDWSFSRRMDSESVLVFERVCLPIRPTRKPDKQRRPAAENARRRYKLALEGTSPVRNTSRVDSPWTDRSRDCSDHPP